MDPETSKELMNEAKAVVPEIYKDIAKPAAQEIGEVAGRTVKALLSPIRGMLWGWEQIEELLEEGIRKRLKNIPVENRKIPEPEIAVPTIEALRYTAQNETLRDMYLNLLSNTMDDRKQNDVHPSFVQIIKQMNTLDALLLKKILLIKNYGISTLTIGEVGNNSHYLYGAFPQWYAGFTIEGYTEFDVSTSFIRLSKFGLIDLVEEPSPHKADYEKINNSSFVTDRFKAYQSSMKLLNLRISEKKGLYFVNEYGTQFKSACQ